MPSSMVDRKQIYRDNARDFHRAFYGGQRTGKALAEQNEIDKPKFTAIVSEKLTWPSTIQGKEWSKFYNFWLLQIGNNGYQSPEDWAEDYFSDWTDDKNLCELKRPLSF